MTWVLSLLLLASPLVDAVKRNDTAAVQAPL
jgi:hypothetical protein